ncbi:MAG: hypothetical protein JWN99_1039 [Ilumatobacteraceae bacterium]|nr:hypothetical protein [Ilumatobacteraceae bacterium]
MFTPSILDTPLHPTGPIDASRPTESLTADWPLLDDGQVQVGIWSCSPGRFTGSTEGENESMYMVAGRATIDYDDGVHDIVPGTLWTTPHDWTSTWTVHQTVRKLYVIDKRSGTGGVTTHLANAATATLGEPTPRATPIAGSPHESSVSTWTHDGLEVGVWQCTPGEFTFRRDGYDEVFCVLSGRATLYVDGADGPGQSFQLVPGWVILTPGGLTGRWVVHDTIRKAYTIIHR